LRRQTQCLKAGLGLGGAQLHLFAQAGLLVGSFLECLNFLRGNAQAFLEQGAFAVLAGDLLVQLDLQCQIFAGGIFGFLELFVGGSLFAEQAFVIAMQLGDFVLAYQGALLSLAQLHLDLLQLPLVATLLLFALFLAGGAVVLQCIPGVQVLFFQGVDLLFLVLQA